MGSLCNESFDDFIEQLKAAGVSISNEAELRERLAEARRWQYAFMTLANNGESLGIRFAGGGQSQTDSIQRMLAHYCFPDRFENEFVNRLAVWH